MREPRRGIGAWLRRAGKIALLLGAIGLIDYVTGYEVAI